MTKQASMFKTEVRNKKETPSTTLHHTSAENFNKRSSGAIFGKGKVDQDDQMQVTAQTWKTQQAYGRNQTSLDY